MMDERAASRAAQGTRKRFLYIGVAAFVIVLVTGGIWWKRAATPRSMSPKPPDIHTSITATVGNRSLGFPAYYPAVSSDRFTLSDSTVALLEGQQALSISLIAGNKTYTINEQRRPPIMEEVKKTKEFNTPLGNAYIADLNGHEAGFLVATKTLVVITSSAPNDPILTELLRSMTTL